MKYCVDYTIVSAASEDCPVSEYVIIEAESVDLVLLGLINLHSGLDEHLHSVQAIYQLGDNVMPRTAVERAASLEAQIAERYWDKGVQEKCGTGYLVKLDDRYLLVSSPAWPSKSMNYIWVSDASQATDYPSSEKALETVLYLSEPGIEVVPAKGAYLAALRKKRKR